MRKEATTFHSARPTIMLGELTEPVSTWTPSRAPATRSFTYIDLGAIDQDTKMIVAPRELPCRDAPSRARQLVATGDILVSTVRPNLNAVARVPEYLDKATASTGFCVLRPLTLRVDTSYLFHWVKTPGFVAEMVKQATGANYPAVSDKIIYGSRIPLPALSEQRRIAAILDKADALRAKRCAALTQLDTLTQSIFLEMFGDPARNTKKLPKVRLGFLGDWQSGGTPSRQQERYFHGSLPWFSSGELEDVVVTSSHESISLEALSETSAKRVPRGALMLGMYDTAALKASLAGVDCSCNQAVAFSKLNERLVAPLYVYYAIVIGREHFRRLQRGVRQKNLNLSMIRDLEIPMAPLDVQIEFSRRATTVDKIKARQRASLAEMDPLFTSLQHRAFRGEL